MLTSRLTRKTAALRAKMAKQRGKVKMFDRGGDIAELKKLCKKETGLDAPRQPESGLGAFLEQQPKARGESNGARLTQSMPFKLHKPGCRHGITQLSHLWPRYGRLGRWTRQNTLCCVAGCLLANWCAQRIKEETAFAVSILVLLSIPCLWGHSHPCGPTR